MTVDSTAAFATFEATASALSKLDPRGHGLRLQFDSVDKDTGEFILDHKTDTGWYQVTGRIYECGLGYHCVVVDDDIWQAPIVWNGPRASWDTTTDAGTLALFAVHVREVLASS